MDLDGLLPSIALTLEKYESVLEVYLFGHWPNINFTRQCEDWLSLFGGKPLVFTSLFRNLSPAVMMNS